MASILSIVLFTSSFTAAQANASVAPVPPISTVDLPQEAEWKPAVNYAAVVASERDVAAQELANPTTKETGFALYTAYDRMLAYMEADLVAGNPIEEIAEKNYKRVVEESYSDPALVNLEAAEFSNLYDALIGMLQQ